MQPWLPRAPLHLATSGPFPHLCYLYRIHRTVTPDTCRPACLADRMHTSRARPTKKHSWSTGSKLSPNHSPVMIDVKRRTALGCIQCSSSSSDGAECRHCRLFDHTGGDTVLSYHIKNLHRRASFTPSRASFQLVFSQTFSISYSAFALSAIVPAFTFATSSNTAAFRKLSHGRLLRVSYCFSRPSVACGSYRLIA